MSDEALIAAGLPIIAIFVVGFAALDLCRLVLGASPALGPKDRRAPRRRSRVRHDGEPQTEAVLDESLAQADVRLEERVPRPRTLRPNRRAGIAALA